MTPTQAALGSAAISAIGITLVSLEHLANRRYTRSIHAPAIVERIHASPESPLPALLRSLLRVVGTPRGVVYLALLAICCAWGYVLVVPHAPTVAAVLALGVICVAVVHHVRTAWGSDGGEIMCIHIWLGLAAFGLARGELAGALAVASIAASLAVSYVAAGLIKLAGPAWRDGSAMALILRTDVFGSPWGERLARGPLGRLVCATVLGFEIFGVLLVLVGPWGTALFLAIGASFHLGVAVCMGINRFVWQFTAAYPATWFVGQLVWPLDATWRYGIIAGALATGGLVGAAMWSRRCRVPILLDEYGGDGGAAALAMSLAAAGIGKVSPVEIRGEVEVEGVSSLDTLRRAAQRRQLAAEILAVPADAVEMLPAGTIVCWSGGWYATYCGGRGDRLVVACPFSGRITMKKDELVQRLLDRPGAAATATAGKILALVICP